MSEKDPTNADGGGNSLEKGERTFTQAELDAILADRLVRERSKYAGFDDLKAKAEKWAEFEESQKSETQKAIEAAQKAQQERDAAIQAGNTAMIKAKFLAVAASQGAEHPEDAYLLAQKNGVAIDDEGNVTGVDTAVQALIDAKRLPLSGKPTAPKLDGGAGGGNPPGDMPTLSEEEIKMARRMNLTPEQYQKAKLKT